MLITFHCNFTLPHQIEHGQWLKQGLEAHGHTLRIDGSPTSESDVHIVSGPHFAKSHWLDHPRVILLDRAYYHDDPPDTWHSMPWVSVGWMNKNGGRDFKQGTGRPVPEIRENHGEGTIFLADYSGPIEEADTVRLHPDDCRYDEPLVDVLRRHRTAIGYNTTALALAGLEGLDVICKSKTSIMSQPNWLQLLPYADWHYSEIQNGELWEHLLQEL